jgi:hypothetical protein
MIRSRTPASRQAIHALPHLGDRPKQRVVAEPFVGKILRHVVPAAFRYRGLDCVHFFLVAGFLPVITVIRQKAVVGQPAPVHHLSGFDVFADTGRDHVANEEAGIQALVLGRASLPRSGEADQEQRRIPRSVNKTKSHRRPVSPATNPRHKRDLDGAGRWLYSTQSERDNIFKSPRRGLTTGRKSNGGGKSKAPASPKTAIVNV